MRKLQISLVLLAMFVFCFTSTGCSSMQKYGTGGILLGGITGLALTGDIAGAGAGAVLGGATGAGYGHFKDKKRVRQVEVSQRQTKVEVFTDKEQIEMLKEELEKERMKSIKP